MKVHKENSSTTVHEIFEQTLSTALSLPVEERTLLVEQLLDSLAGQNQEEIENRVRAIDEGRVQLIPGDEVIRQLRSKFK
jgi:putative addiction module component (TIGR02574 family)